MIGSRQPNARTLTTAIRHQATTRPSGSASSAVSAARARVLASSSAASRRRVTPIAHSGASWAGGPAEREQAREQRDAGDAEGQGVERGGDREGLLEDAARIAPLRTPGRRCAMPAPNRLAARRSAAARSAGATRTPKRVRSRIAANGGAAASTLTTHLALRIAVVGIDAGDRRRARRPCGGNAKLDRRGAGRGGGASCSLTSTPSPRARRPRRRASLRAAASARGRSRDRRSRRARPASRRCGVSARAIGRTAVTSGWLSSQASMAAALGVVCAAT